MKNITLRLNKRCRRSYSKPDAVIKFRWYFTEHTNRYFKFVKTEYNK